MVFTWKLVSLFVSARIVYGAVASTNHSPEVERNVGFCKGNPNVVYRAYSNETYDTDHLYSTNINEVEGQRPRFHRETDCCRVFTSPDQTDATVVPFYRLYNTAHWDHFYTTNVVERDAALATGLFRSEGILGYVMTEAGCGSYPLYRLYRDDAYTVFDHFYTIDAAERDRAIATGKYRSEGIAAWVWPTCDIAPCSP